MIYHYTDAGALINIIGNHTLWASHILHLNDPNEYLFPDEIAREIAAELKYSLPEVTHLGHPHVVCFSRKSDDLNQFRSYADDARGYAIGFDSDELISSLDMKQFVFLEEINYGDKNEIRAFLKKRLSEDKAIEDAKNLEEKSRIEREGLTPALPGIPLFLRGPSHSVEVGMYAYKTKHYQEESEIRIIVSTQEPEYRSRGYKIIPFVKLDFKNLLPIKEIIVGPGQEKSTRDNTIKAIYDLCVKRQGKHINVTPSDIDYRPSR
jgi:hypothetical protein